MPLAATLMGRGSDMEESRLGPFAVPPRRGGSLPPAAALTERDLDLEGMKALQPGSRKILTLNQERQCQEQLDHALCFGRGAVALERNDVNLVCLVVVPGWSRLVVSSCVSACVRSPLLLAAMAPRRRAVVYLREVKGVPLPTPPPLETDLPEVKDAEPPAPPTLPSLPRVAALLRPPPGARFRRVGSFAVLPCGEIGRAHV